MRPFKILFYVVALLALTGSTAAQTLSCGNDPGYLAYVTEFPEFTLTRNATCSGYQCYAAEQPSAPFLRLHDAACDALSGPCKVELVVPLQFPGNKQTVDTLSGTVTPYLFWFESEAPPPGCEPWKSSTCGEVSQCGYSGQPIYDDVVETFLQEIGRASCRERV